MFLQVAAASGHLAEETAGQVINAGDAKAIFRALPFWLPVISGQGGVINDAVGMVHR